MAFSDLSDNIKVHNPLKDKESPHTLLPNLVLEDYSFEVSGAQSPSGHKAWLTPGLGGDPERAWSWAGVPRLLATLPNHTTSYRQQRHPTFRRNQSETTAEIILTDRVKAHADTEKYLKIHLGKVKQKYFCFETKNKWSLEPDGLGGNPGRGTDHSCD